MAERSGRGTDVDHYTYCAICEQLCGLKVTTRDDRVVRISPDRENPHNWADFCIKGATADALRTHPRRLRSPMKRIGERYVAVTHEEAIEGIARQFSRIAERDGPNAIWAYVGNPAAFGFANSVFHGAFMEALGSHNRYWVGSIDQNAYHYVGEAMYGSAFTTLIPDVDVCECFLLIGANPAISGMAWIGAVPNGWKRVRAAVDRGADLIVVDPRRTETARHATHHLSPVPETDWAFLLAVLHFIFTRGLVDSGGCEASANVGVVRDIACAQNPDDLASHCGIPVGEIEAAAMRFGSAKTACCVVRTGGAMGRNGALSEWLSHVLNLVTGRTDKRGGRVLCDGVADLMQLGSEVFPQARQPSRIRGWDPIAGAHALAELPEEILTPGHGQIRGLIINSGNPVISGPNGLHLDAALQSLECLVAIDMFQRESHCHAHWLIPGVHFLEREEINLLFGSMHESPFIQQSRKVLDAPKGIRHEWEFYRDLADRMGLTLFDGTLPPDPCAVEDAILGLGGRVSRDEIECQPHGLRLGGKTYGRLAGKLCASGRRIDAAPKALVGLLRTRLADITSSMEMQPNTYQLISRRRLQTMNSWLTESSAAKLRGGVGEQVTICPKDAVRDGLTSGKRVRIESGTGSLEATLMVDDSLRPGVAVMEHGWGSRTFDPAGSGESVSSGLNRNQLVSNEDLDPLSRVPRFNGAHVRIRRA